MHTSTVDSLNELLEAERAGVETLIALKGQYSNLATDLERVEKDEVWSCSGLHHCILRLGGNLSAGKGDFAQKVMDLETLNERLHLLARGQQWVIRKIDDLLKNVLDGETRSFLQEMREVHERNVNWCQRQEAVSGDRRRAQDEK